jgi:hypothetical protein
MMTLLLDVSTQPSLVNAATRSRMTDARLASGWLPLVLARYAIGLASHAASSEADAEGVGRGSLSMLTSEGTDRAVTWAATAFAVCSVKLP